MSRRFVRAAMAACLAAVLVACPRDDRNEPERDLRFEVSLGARQLSIYRGDSLIRTEPVSVGQPEWPTPTGSWEIFRVDWNPDWEPPDSEWAAGQEYTPPGHPDNPMGRARLVYDPPYTLHGTDDLPSLGHAQSHGSIRIANAAVTELARLLMEEGGAGRDEAWYRETLDNPTEMRQVELPDPVPITVRD